MRLSRDTKVRCAIAATSVLVLTATSMAACGLVEPVGQAERLVQHFTEALDHQDATAAASLTTYPNGAAAALKQMFDGLKADNVDYRISQFIRLDEQSGFFTLDVAWHLGRDRDWTYSVQGSVRQLAVGWRISWDPSVVLPQLAAGRTVQLVRTDAAPPRVLDAYGRVLMTEQNLNAVKLDPAKMPDPAATTAAVAKAIEPVAPLITAQSLMQDLVVAQGKPINAVLLRDGDFEILMPALRPIPGVVLEKQPKLITADRRIGSPVLDGLRNVWQANRDATAGWAVRLFRPDGADPIQLAGFQGPPGPDVLSTLDFRLQLAAADAVASVGTPAAIVAIQPSSGAVVAVAQNAQAGETGPLALTGQYPAGSALDLFRWIASMDKKIAPQDVSADDAVRAAAALGIGVDFKIAGLNETTGRVPGAGVGLEPAWASAPNRNAIMVSPFGMAIAASTLAKGSLPTPMIAYGQPGGTEAQVAPPRPDVLDRVRAAMRETVDRPENVALRAFPDVVGLTAAQGSTQWFLGNRGDLAFAVLVADADGGDAAVRVTARMMKSWATPLPDDRR